MVQRLQGSSASFGTQPKLKRGRNYPLGQPFEHLSPNIDALSMLHWSLDLQIIEKLRNLSVTSRAAVWYLY